METGTGKESISGRAGAIVLVALAVSAACGTTVASSSGAPADDSAGNPADAGIYHSGSDYICCGPGEGAACCTADAGLLGYEPEPDGAILVFGGKPPGSVDPTEANCFQYGGIWGGCTSEGALFDGKDACALCCAGLVRANPMILDDAGTCVESVAPSAFECIPCGNGTCDSDENSCTCPSDCVPIDAAVAPED